MMRSGTVAFVGGVLLLQQASVLPSVSWLFLFPLAISGLFSRRAIVRMLAAFGMGVLWALAFATLALDRQWPMELEGQDLWVEGYVSNLPQQHERGVEFDLMVNRWENLGTKLNARHLRLRWYQAVPSLHPGQLWRLQVRLKRPRGYMNPGGFDYESWLFRNGVDATGYVKVGAHNLLLTDRAQDYPVQRLRESLRERLRQQLVANPAQGFILALTLGEREMLEDSQWEVMQRTGTNHLMAISGLHIGLVAAWSYLVMFGLWRLIASNRWRWPAQVVAAWASMLSAMVYAAMAGFAIPTQRALIMVCVVLLSLILRRATTPGRTLSLAALLVTLYDPFAVLAPGFWLSFSAVGLILYVSHGRVTVNNKWWRWGHIQWAVSLGLLPLLMLFFQQASIISPLANAVAIPWVSLMVVPLSLIGTLFTLCSDALAGPILTLAAWAMQVIWWLLQTISQWDLAVWHGLAPSWWRILLACLGIMIILAPGGLGIKLPGVVLLLPILSIPPERPSESELLLSVLDVGQGLAAVVETRRHVLVFDTGPRFSRVFDTGKAVVTPFLRAKGWERIDTLVISHGDQDHIGGYASLRKAFPVKRLLSSVPSTLGTSEAELCLAGQHWLWDGVVFDVLHPRPGSSFVKRPGNNRSCVLRVSAGPHSLILVGDIEAEAEQALLGRGIPETTVLVVPHHGSKTSSTEAFIQQLAPQWALIPAGHHNRYRFPHPLVVSRYLNAGIRLGITGEMGALRTHLGGNSPEVIVTGFRQQQRRYWRPPIRELELAQ